MDRDQPALGRHAHRRWRDGSAGIPAEAESQVSLNGNNDLYGSVIANRYTFNGNNTIRYTAGYFSSGGSEWSFAGNWLEANPR